MTSPAFSDADRPPHQCDVMRSVLEDPRVPVVYNAVFREYSIPLASPSDAIQQLFYCPWCGALLPASLRIQVFDEVEELNGEEPDDYFDMLRDAPEPFHSGRWWYGRYDWAGNQVEGDAGSLP